MKGGAFANAEPEALPNRSTDRETTRLEGRFELGRELGRGSTGVVWEAWDRLTAETVAVKILRGEPFDAGGANRRAQFRREVGSASALAHPHTVRVLAHGETADGHGFMVMERLSGTTLATRLRAEKALAQVRAIGIAAQILDAISAAHRMGTVHRDLKPGNVILIERDGDPDFVKVCDFGLAKAIEPEIVDGDGERAAGEAPSGNGPGSTGRWEICGTPEYMAPEQARGEPIDARADLYAVGVILFEAVVGRLPFVGRTSLDVVSQHLSAAPPRPTAVRPDLRIFPPLENLILRALSKNRAERPSSARVFRADLLQIKRDLLRAQRDDGASAPLEAATLPRRSSAFTPRRDARSRRGVAAAVAAAAILASISAGAILRHRRQALEPDAVAVTGGTSIGGGRGISSPEPPDARAGQGPTHGLTSRSEASAATSTLASMRVAPGESIRRSPPARSSSPRSAPASEAAQASAPPRHRLARTAAGNAATSAASIAPAAVEVAAGTRSPADLLIESGDALLARGRVAEACARGREAVEAAPAAPAAWEFLGRCSMRLGQPAQARAAYRRYLEVAPASPHAQFVRAIVEQGGR